VPRETVWKILRGRPSVRLWPQKVADGIAP
jgi:hypothetical protein